MSEILMVGSGITSLQWWEQDLLILTGIGLKLTVGVGIKKPENHRLQALRGEL